MPRRCIRVVESFYLLLLVVSLGTHPALAQFDTATISGQVVDPSGLSVTGARVTLVDIDRETSTSSTTNGSGLYTFPSVRPGRYRMEVTKGGFRIVNVTGLTVNVQDHLEQNFKLVVGSVSESVTVEGGAPLVNTESAEVSTVVDRNFAENLPMNGRSFQTLIELTPGVVITPTNTNDNGQFSVNGQRAVSNYWMLDGVSANVGIGLNQTGVAGNGLAGAVGSFSVLGGTNSLVSVDALQEFRIQTSTYAPEFGRTPGAQISIITRSGTNQLHGTLFNYFRNDVLDANDWFADRDKLDKPQERQNDFGGTLGGPILKSRTFFFVSYEGLRLRLPQVQPLAVPDLAARQNAVPAMQPYLNVFPLPTPTALDDPTTGVAKFRETFSNKASLDAGSIRIDHRLTDKLSVFGRYNYSPSNTVQRDGAAGVSLASLAITTQTITAGASWAISSLVSNDFRFNYSRTTSSGNFSLDNFGTATPLASLPFPSGITSQSGTFWFYISTVKPFLVGNEGKNLQRQINFIDNVSLQRGSHTIKFGVDYRRLSPQVSLPQYRQWVDFSDVPSAEKGNASFTILDSTVPTTFLFRNLSAFAQDTWRIVPRLTLTYGLRWDVDFVPQSLSGPGFPAAVGFDLNNFSSLGVAPAGTAPYATHYANFAPRVGVAYGLSQRQDWQTVLRGGVGVFYDLASSEAGNNVAIGLYPFGGESLSFSGTFPLTNPNAPAISFPTASNPQGVYLFDPHLKLPYTMQWNAALEQGLGRQQSLSVSYVGAAGRRQLQTTSLFLPPSPTIAFTELVTNAGTSDYDALQVQFQRRLSHGVQALTSYTWSHSIDTGSAGSIGVVSNAGLPSVSGSNRGPSDFDIRHTFSAGVTYDIPALKINALTNAVLGGWSLENIVQVRSAPPVDITYLPAFFSFANGIYGDVRPDLVPGQPLYLYGAECASIFQATQDLAPRESCPGGRGFNPSAFTAPATYPTGQGTTPRNFLRGFSAAQWDFAIHRQFKLSDSLKLQFRAEMFNLLNHPNLGPLSGQFGNGQGFGLSTAMLGRSFSDNLGGAGSGGFSSLYQIGGPRSVQLALKLAF